MTSGTCTRHDAARVTKDFPYDIYECPCGWFGWPQGSDGPQGPCPKCSAKLTWKCRLPLSVSVCSECASEHDLGDEALPSFVEFPNRLRLDDLRRLARIAKQRRDPFQLWHGAEFAFIEATQDDFQAAYGRLAGEELYAEVQVKGPVATIKTLEGVPVVWKQAAWFGSQ